MSALVCSMSMIIWLNRSLFVHTASADKVLKADKVWRKYSLGRNRNTRESGRGPLWSRWRSCSSWARRASTSSAPTTSPWATSRDTCWDGFLRLTITNHKHRNIRGNAQRIKNCLQAQSPIQYFKAMWKYGSEGFLPASSPGTSAPAPGGSSRGHPWTPGTPSTPSGSVGWGGRGGCRSVHSYVPSLNWIRTIAISKNTK